MPPLTPQLAQPITIRNGNVFATVEQGSLEDIAGQVWALLMYRPGELDADPDFGVPDQAFRQGGPSSEVLLAAIRRYVPDVDVLVNEDPSRLEELIGRVTIEVRGIVPEE